MVDNIYPDEVREKRSNSLLIYRTAIFLLPLKALLVNEINTGQQYLYVWTSGFTGFFLTYGQTAYYGKYMPDFQVTSLIAGADAACEVFGEN